MVNKTRSVPMIFNHLRWANDVLARRLEHGLTTYSIATLTGLNQSTIAAYERGEISNMKMQHFLALTNVYDLDPREYFELER